MHVGWLDDVGLQTCWDLCEAVGVGFPARRGDERTVLKGFPDARSKAFDADAVARSSSVNTLWRMTETTSMETIPERNHFARLLSKPALVGGSNSLGHERRTALGVG